NGAVLTLAGNWRDALHDASAHSSGRSCHPLELDQPADVVTKVHHSDLESRPHDPDRAHELAPHRVLLVAKYMLDTGTDRIGGNREYDRHGPGRLQQWFHVEPPPARIGASAASSAAPQR